MTDAGLELRDLSRSFGSRAAVREMSLCVQPGEVVGLLGPNGAGKSTTIFLLTGFLTPTAGDILWEGSSIFPHLAQWRRQIGVVLEDLCLFEYLSVGEHLLLAGQLAGLSPREAKRRTEELLAFFQLEEHMQTVAAQASAGTRKKLAFALSLIHSPRVLLLDEATNGIDAITVGRIKGLLGKLASTGVAIIMSSHVLDSIEPIIERCIIMNKGRVSIDAPLAKLKSSYGSLEEAYTQTILGSDNPRPELSWVQ